MARLRLDNEIILTYVKHRRNIWRLSCLICGAFATAAPASSEREKVRGNFPLQPPNYIFFQLSTPIYVCKGTCTCTSKYSFPQNLPVKWKWAKPPVNPISPISKLKKKYLTRVEGKFEILVMMVNPPRPPTASWFMLALPQDWLVIIILGDNEIPCLGLTIRFSMCVQSCSTNYS